jgi:hypothetical protein
VQKSEWGYIAITAIPSTAPARITAVAHGLPAKWPVLIEAVGGMTQINSVNNKKNKGWYIATKIDANTIELNDVNPALFSAYTSGGYVRYLLPRDLTGHSARAQIRATVDAEAILVDFTVANGRVVIDVPNSSVALTLTDEDTAAMTWSDGFIDGELLALDGTIPPWELSEPTAIGCEAEVTR